MPLMTVVASGPRPKTRVSSDATCNAGDHHREECGALHEHKITTKLCSSMKVGPLPGSTLVELRGLEPLTPTLPVWCATSCATAPRSRRRRVRAQYYTGTPSA